MKNIIQELLLSVILISLFYLYSLYGVVAAALIGMALMLGLAIFRDPISCLLIAFMLSPHGRMFRIEGNPMTLVGIFLFIVQLKYLIKEKKNFKFVFLLMLLFTSITTLIYEEYSNFATIIRVFVFFLFFSSLFKNNLSEEDKSRIIISYIFGVVSVVVVTILNTIINPGAYFTSVGNDRNYFASEIACAIAIVIIFNSYTHYLKKSVSIVILLLLLFGGLMSGSRTFLIVMTLVALLLVRMGFSTRKQVRNASFYYLFAFIILGIILLPVFLPKLQDVLFSRFQEENLTSANGRTEAWQFYINLWLSEGVRIIFGNGPANAYLDSIGMMEHSLYVQILSNYGVLGGLTVLSCYISLYKTIVNKNKYPLWMLIPLMILLIYNGTISTLFGSTFDIPYVVSLTLLSFNYSDVYYMQNRGVKNYQS